jgi:hypothetical protein
VIYIYRPQGSDSARSLADSIAFGRRARDHENLIRRLKPGDTVVMWGAHLNPQRFPQGVKVLNNVEHRNKLQDALTLKEKGVPTIEVSKERPILMRALVPPPDPAVEAWKGVFEAMEGFPVVEQFPGRNEAIKKGVTDAVMALVRLEKALSVAAPVAPAAPQIEWLGRTRNHVGGKDLLQPPAQPDYWVKKEDIVAEYRVHSFNGKSLRAGMKKPIEGAEVHKWVRSLAAGWKISYDGVSSKQKHRDLAHSAVKALGLIFGAVDIAELKDGRLIVLEVNRAPGLDGGTIDVYSKAISEWAAS